MVEDFQKFLIVFCSRRQINEVRFRWKDFFIYFIIWMLPDCLGFYAGTK